MAMKGNTGEGQFDHGEGKAKETVATCRAGATSTANPLIFGLQRGHARCIARTGKDPFDGPPKPCCNFSPPPEEAGDQVEILDAEAAADVIRPEAFGVEDRFRACRSGDPVLPTVYAVGPSNPGFLILWTIRIVSPTPNGGGAARRGSSEPEASTESPQLACELHVCDFATGARRGSAERDRRAGPSGVFGRTGAYRVEFRPGESQWCVCAIPALSNCGAIPRGSCGVNPPPPTT
jgi:hypothetical protein